MMFMVLCQFLLIVEREDLVQRRGQFCQHFFQCLVEGRGVQSHLNQLIRHRLCIKGGQ